MDNMPAVDIHVMVLSNLCVSIFIVMLQDDVDGKFISTDIRYRKGMAIAESGDKVDSVGGADTVNESNMDVVSGGGEGDGKDNASLYETLGMIDGGEVILLTLM